MAKRPLPIGIDDLAVYVPKLFLEIADLAAARGIAPEKLRLGLGLEKMALPDVHEDAATMAAEAVFELFQKNDLDPRRVGRLYLGTESALDGAKPTATYALDMVRQKLAAQHGADCFRHCDAVDLTFACIGAVDALQNCLDWLAADRERVAIVVASDLAKYDLASTGEYTQGAGAVAMLLKWNPNLLIFNNLWGVATESVHDFFKPRRRFQKNEIVQEVLAEAGLMNGAADKVLAKFLATSPAAAVETRSFLQNGEPLVEVFREMPVFDGQFSNQCYQQRMTEALAHFRELAVEKGLFSAQKFRALSDRWARLIFHLPYAFHAKRIFVEQFVFEQKEKGAWAIIQAKLAVAEPEKSAFGDSKSFEKAKAGWLKSVAESIDYQRFVVEKLEKAQRASSEIGNVYTASIFVALMSSLESDRLENVDLTGQKIGFVAYGSGSKAKVFEAEVQPGWREKVAGFRLFEKLTDRRAVSYDEYEALHTGRQATSFWEGEGRFALKFIESGGIIAGARHYQS